MTVMTSAEVEAYLHAVIDALSDLDPDVRADLLEDLPGHLAEVAAEGDVSLVDRLGDPREYAAELRAAAGLADDNIDPRPSRRDQLAQLITSGEAVLERADVLGGRLLGYPRLADCLRALRPGWWVVRGFLLAWILAFAYGNRGEGGVYFFADRYASDSSRLLGLIFLTGCVVLSIRIGRSCARWSVGARRVLFVAGVLLAVYGLPAAARSTLLSSGSGPAQYSFDVTPTAIPAASGSAAATAAPPSDGASVAIGQIATPAVSATPSP